MAKLLGKWWVGARCECKYCGERFELDDTDKPNQYGRIANIACPSCGTLVNVDRPLWKTAGA